MDVVSVCNACHLLLLHLGMLTSCYQWMLLLFVVHGICFCSVLKCVPLHLELHAFALF